MDIPEIFLFIRVSCLVRVLLEFLAQCKGCDDVGSHCRQLFCESAYGTARCDDVVEEQNVFSLESICRERVFFAFLIPGQEWVGIGHSRVLTDLLTELLKASCSVGLCGSWDADKGELLGCITKTTLDEGGDVRNRLRQSLLVVVFRCQFRVALEVDDIVALLPVFG